MDYMGPDVHCPQKAIKLNHSLNHSQLLLVILRPVPNGQYIQITFWNVF